MKKVNELLVIFIFILTALLVATVGFKAYSVYDTKRQLAREQEELEVARVFTRNQEAQNRVREMEIEIQELTGDVEKLEKFIMQIESGEVGSSTVQDELMEDSAAVNEAVSGNEALWMDRTVTGNATVSGDGIISSSRTVSGNGTISGDGTVSGNRTVSGNEFFEDGLYGPSDGGTVSGNRSVSGNFMGFMPDGVSANGEVNYYDGSMTESSIFDAWRGIYEQPDGMSLTERRQLRTSLQETLEVNQSDRERIAENKRDFSGLKIACLGDSITAAANLEGEEDYQQYSYPARLKELLNAEEVYNLGIGGSSIGRYWADAYVDRYQEIPEDVDAIIVMGGTNDGFCVSDKEFGSLEERTYRTFCGDLDELMRGLREHYPKAEIFFATPLPNILQDYLMCERDYLLPQQDFVDVIRILAQEYDYEVIDLYNSNILDSHDANVVAEYIPDGVHGNHAGYQIMAEHFAAELIEHYDEEEAGESFDTEDKEEFSDTEEKDGEGKSADTEGKDGKEETVDTEGRDGKEESADTEGKDGEEESADTEGKGGKEETADTEGKDDKEESADTEGKGDKKKNSNTEG